MNWGEELWDQYDNLSAHTNKGIEFLDKYGQFIKERCAIELEYASKLRRLAKNYQFKRKEDEDNQYTYCKALFLMTREVSDLAGQHELVSENMSAQIVKEISILLKELKDERKRYLTEGAKHQTALQTSLAQLDKAKKAYEKAYKEAEKAQDNYQKADADYNLSRAEVEKARMISSAKNQMCEDCKTEYANQLQKSNELQRLYYNEQMPKIFHQLQDMEERRIACLQNYMKQSAVLHRHVFPIIDKCLDGIIKASESIDPKEDNRLVVERYKSGNLQPEDIPFEDLSNPKPITEDSGPKGTNSLTYSHSIKSETIRGTLSAARFKKRGGIFAIFSSSKSNLNDSKDDYADLPPNQRRKRIQAKIDQIQSQIQQETAVRDGLMRMKQAYEQNPALGDPSSVEGQLTENGHKMEKLQTELRKFQSYLVEVDGRPQTPINQKKTHAHRNSVSEDSLSRSASDSSVGNNHRLSNQITNHNHNNHNQNGTNQENNDSSNSPESGISTSHLSIPDAEFADSEDFDEEHLPVLGCAKALYAFEAQSEGSIAMFEGEELEVVELDQGDGWTRVRKMDRQEEGFVPTSYIKCDLNHNC